MGTMTLNVTSSDRIEQIKARINERDCIPVNQQHLYFREKKLLNSNTLVYYDIQKESTLFLRIGDSMQIFVEETSGKTITLDDVLETDTVETIKAEIEEKEGIPIA